jgi:hypothetical protein
MNSTKTSMRWDYVNLKNILGELYDKHERFNFKLVSAVYLSGSDTDISCNLQVNLRGLPFINGQNFQPIGLVKTGNSATSSITQIMGNTSITFQKPTSDTTTLYIDLLSLGTGNISTATFGNQSYLFVLTPQ